MKKSIYIILSLFLFIPFIVNAETLTYDVCESGCEYTSFWDVSTAINNISDLSDKDIIINVNSDMNDYLGIGNFDNMPNSVTINGNNHSIDYIQVYTKNIIINDLKINSELLMINYQTIKINNSSIHVLLPIHIDENENISEGTLDLSERLQMDNSSMNSIKILVLWGNYIIRNMDLSNAVIINMGKDTTIYDSKINKIYARQYGFSTGNMDIYNSKFNTLRYTNLTSENSPGVVEWNEFDDGNLLDNSAAMLNYDIYDINVGEGNDAIHFNTYVYFDKEAKLKPGDRINLTSYLDYYTEDKEIEYTIEDESIAKIENKELIGLKEGSTKVTVTTDEGHVVYRINLVVEKETIPEKIDKMTIKVPITGSKVKAWIVVVSVLLLGIIGVCVYIIIKRKK